MADAKDFFVSYTGADIAWAEWIADTLERSGYTTVLQAWDFRPGEVFVQRMQEAVEQATRTIMVLSPAYLDSAFATSEWQSVFARDPTGENAFLLPVRIAACHPLGVLRARIWIDLVDTDESTAAERLLAGVTPGRLRPAGPVPFPRSPTSRPQEEAPRFPGHHPPIFNAPPRNLHFTGRDNLLRDLHQQLAELRVGAVVQTEAVHGLGGVGKTQLALEYAHRYAADYDVVWWVQAEQPLTIGGQLAALAGRLGLPELPSLDDQVATVFEELGRRGGWLLVYDNADEPAGLDELRPSMGSGHVLVTSRNPVWGGSAATIRMDVLDRGEAVAFLRRRLGDAASDLDALASALGDLPLALEQAASYLEETGTPPREYLNVLKDHAPELLARGRPANSEQTIATTWSVALERLEVEAPAARDLLCVCAFLAPEDIPRGLLPDHSEVLPERLAAAVANPFTWHETIGALRRYSLVTTSGQMLGVHRLVQAVVRHGLDPGQTHQWAHVALKLVERAFPAEAYEFEHWAACALLLPHAGMVLEHVGNLAAQTVTAAALLEKMGLYLWRRAEYVQAHSLLERSLAIREADLDSNDLAIAGSLYSLALVVHAEGDLQRARRLHERALTIRETRLGGDHLDVAWSLNDLANVLRDQRDLVRARALHERALAICEARLGPDHPHTATTLNSLAGVLQAQGDYDGARALNERALAICEARLGPDHPDTATTLNNLASVLQDQGDYRGARPLLTRSLAIYQARLGGDHPETARVLQNLGVTLAHLGRIPAARVNLTRAHSILKQSLGSNHPTTIQCRRNLLALGGGRSGSRHR